jgi:hypothetical protein
MKKKLYIQPSLEILPFGMLSALCGSGEGGSTDITNSDEGGDPWSMGNSPKRRVYF